MDLGKNSTGNAYSNNGNPIITESQLKKSILQAELAAQKTRHRIKENTQGKIEEQKIRNAKLRKMREKREEELKKRMAKGENTVNGTFNFLNEYNNDGNFLIKTDISTVITKNNDKGIILISDIEGINPTRQINEIIKHNEEGGKIIFLGDLCDYTFAIGSAMSSVGINNDNLCQLKMLKLMVNGMKNNTCQCILGNRDLNKIKLIPLLLLKNRKEWWKKQEGERDFIDIAYRLYNNINNKTYKWLMDDINAVNPFWVDQSGINKIKKRKTMEDNLYTRYLRIFGKDPDDGSMSAQETLVKLPIEAMIHNIELYTIENNNYIDYINQRFPNIKNKDNLCSALVFTIYARMLFEPLTNPEDIFFSHDGYLREYLTNATVCKFANVNNKLFLFSHGGISNNFLNQEDIFKNLNSVNWNNIRNNLSKKQSGGNNSMKINDVIKKLRQINHNTLTLIKKMFENPYKNTINNNNFSNDMLKLISLSAPVHKNEKIKLYYKNSNLSPIVTGKPKDSININDTEVYNIFGHIPAGMGYSISKSGNTYSINTDTSNGLLKTDYLINKDKYNDNYLLLFLDSNSELKLKGDIFVNPNNIKFNENPYNEIINYTYNSNIVIQNLSAQKINDIKIQFNSEFKYNDKYNNFDYHGICDVYIDNQIKGQHKNVTFGSNNIQYNVYKCNIFSKTTMENGVFNRVLGLEKDTNNSNSSFGFGSSLVGGSKKRKNISKKRTKKIIK